MIAVPYAALERAAAFSNRRDGKLSTALRFLERAGYGPQFFGFESVECAGRTLRYLNSGDTYAETILRVAGGCEVGSWGDWCEQTEAEHCEESGEIRCGYCSAFTKCAEEWRDTVCHCCGHNVGG